MPDHVAPDPDGSTSEGEDETLLERLREAALEAEFETGRREETELQARRQIFRRLLRISAGSVLLFAGLLMLVLPGPGWLVIAAGLGVLSHDVAWAGRMLERVRKRVPGAQPDGRLSLATWAGVVVVSLAATSASIWFMLR